MVKRTSIEDLVGLELSSVCFVRNYVEFHFDGPILRSLAPPTIELDGHVAAFPGAGSRDALCELIGRVVDKAEDLPDRLTLGFTGSAQLTISKTSEDAGAEIAHLVPAFAGKVDVASMATWENRIPTRRHPGG